MCAVSCANFLRYPIKISQFARRVDNNTGLFLNSLTSVHHSWLAPIVVDDIVIALPFTVPTNLTHASHLTHLHGEVDKRHAVVVGRAAKAGFAPRRPSDEQVHAVAVREEVLERVEVSRRDPLPQHAPAVVAVRVQTAVGQAAHAAERVEELEPVVRVAAQQQEVFRHDVGHQLGVSHLE